MVAVLLAIAIFGTTFGASAPAAAAEPTWFEPGPAEPAPYNCLRGDLLVRSYLPCDAGTRPPDLINPAYLEAGLAPGDQLYVADPAQRAALEAIQDQAIRNVLRTHQLPDDDYDAVKSWARAEVISELWLLVYAAVLTPPGDRTQEQAGVADWMLHVTQRLTLLMREQAAREYAKWAGIDPTPLNAVLDAPGVPQREQLEAVLSGDPLPYSPFGGYCEYNPPGGGYTGGSDPTCAAPCTTPLGCPPPTPESDSFLMWGFAAAMNTYFGNVDFVQNTTLALVAIAYSGAVAGGIGIGVEASSALLIAAKVEGSLARSTVKALVPRVINKVSDWVIKSAAATAAGQTGKVTLTSTTLSAGSAVAVNAALFAITTIITEGIELSETTRKPADMANAVISAHGVPENFDLYPLVSDVLPISDFIRDRMTQTLFWLVMGAVAPVPALGTHCDNVAIIDVRGPVARPCLNATPRHTPSVDDPMFQISRRDGQGPVRRSSTFTVYNADAGNTTSVALAGNWWLGSSVMQNGSGQDWQSLRLEYVGWEGIDRAVWAVDDAGRTRFVEVDLGTEANPTNPPLTCKIECRLVDEIHYVGPGGVEYVARIAPPTPDTTPSTMTFFPVAARVTEALASVTFTYSKPPTVSPTVELRRDGILLRRMTSADLQFLPADGRQWTFPLSGADVGEQGQYTFTVLNQGVTDLQGNPFAGGNQSVTWYMDEAPRAEIDHDGNRLPAGDVPFVVRFLRAGAPCRHHRLRVARRSTDVRSRSSRGRGRADRHGR